MTVSIPITLTTIETAWGTQVATDVNGLLARTTALEGLNISSRLGTAEGNIIALSDQNERQGLWVQRTTGQTIGTTVATMTWQAYVEQVAGWALEPDLAVVQVPSGMSGVYAVFARVSFASSDTVQAWVVIDDTFEVPLSPRAPSLGISWMSAGAVTLRLDSGQNVRIKVQTAGGFANVTGHFHVWRVSI